jgi:hypothetical protein
VAAIDEEFGQFDSLFLRGNDVPVHGQHRPERSGYKHAEDGKDRVFA